MKGVYFIGIAGGSCSGKTTLARRLAERLGPDRTACIAIDSYYHRLASAGPEEIDRYNFDEPSALDHELLVTHLRGLSVGRAIDRPVYDFKTHARTGDVVRVDPVPFVVVEGLFTLYWEGVRELLSTKVFIEVPHAVCYARRLERDTRDRGRPREEVLRRYEEMTRPMFETYVLPTRRFADVAVSGEQPVDASVETMMTHIQR